MRLASFKSTESNIVYRRGAGDKHSETIRAEGYLPLVGRWQRCSVITNKSLSSHPHMKAI